MDKYFYPIPKDKLITRFKPVFDQLSKTRNVTLLALPFAGRSSHLRFIATQPKVQTELGVLFTKKIIWTESENYSDFGQFISQICISIDSTNTNHSSILSRDVFLIQTLLKSIIKSQGEIILIISLGRLNQALAPDIEQLFTLLQKENPNLKILWSIDTTIFRNYSPKHASCSLLENIYYFPTFNLEETRHSLERISRAKQKKLSKALKDICLNETGGLAGLFHLCLFRQNPDLGHFGVLE